MRSIGKKNINLVMRRTRQEVEKQRTPWGSLSDVDYQVVRENVKDSLPETIWDTWESACTQIEHIIEDELTKYAHGIYK
jgi:hypothetical protein